MEEGAEGGKCFSQTHVIRQEGHRRRISDHSFHQEPDPPHLVWQEPALGDSGDSEHVWTDVFCPPWKVRRAQPANSNIKTLLLEIVVKIGGCEFQEVPLLVRHGQIRFGRGSSFCIYEAMAQER